MPLATWIVTSHLRPRLLAQTLAHLATVRVPTGWEVEVVIACYAPVEPPHGPNAAFAREVEASAQCAVVARDLGARVELTAQRHPSGKRNHALRASRGELVLTTDDDDFQSVRRLELAAAAYTAGHKLSGIREFRRVHLATGQVVRVCGQGSDVHALRYGAVPEMAPVICGTARNYARSLLERHGGWNAALSGEEDHDLHRRITKRRGAEAPLADHDLGDALATDTIVLQHEANIFVRPEVKPGQMTVHGSYLLVGEGHYRDLADFPADVAVRLDRLVL